MACLVMHIRAQVQPVGYPLFIFSYNVLDILASRADHMWTKFSAPYYRLTFPTIGLALTPLPFPP